MSRRRVAAGRLLAALGGGLLVAGVLAACGGGSGRSTPSPGPTSVPTTSPTSPAASTTAASTPPPSPSPTDRADQVLAGLDLAHRAGQLVMTGLRFGQSTAATSSALRDHAVGNVFLGGRSSAGTSATASVLAGLQAAAPGGVPLLVSTDQEGGEVQVLSGPGFDAMPSGVEQGGLAPGVLQGDAQRWGGQLVAAGVRMDLAPVLDTVPAGADNPPIGGYDREYGHDPATVSAHGVAFAQGLGAAGVAATGKHFPGLGRVTANTDTDADVVDDVTTATDPYLQPFRDAIAAGIPAIMVSSAVYPRIDGSSIAAFSPVVVTQLLRGQLGFGGVVTSDDLGSAVAVSSVPVGQRAVRFVAAGGDLVLDVDPTQAGQLVDALVAQAQADPSFAARVDESARRVLELKARLGLLG